MASRVEQQPPELPVKQRRSRSSTCSSVDSDYVTFSQQQNYACNDVFSEPTDCHAAQCPIHQRYDPSRHQVRFFSDDTPPPVPKKRLARTLSLPGPTADQRPPLSPLNFDNPLYMLASVPDSHFQEETEEVKPHVPFVSFSQLSFDTPDQLLHFLFSRFHDHTVVSRGIQHRHLLFLQSTAHSVEAHVLLQGDAPHSDVSSFQLQDFLLREGSEAKLIGDRVYYGLRSPRLPGRTLALRIHKHSDDVSSAGTKLQPSHVNVQRVIAAAKPPGGGRGGGRGGGGAHNNPNLTSVQSLLQDGLLVSVERDLPQATLEDFALDAKSGDCCHAGYDRQVCVLLLQILTGSQHLYDASAAAAELRPRGIFLVWDENSGDEGGSRSREEEDHRGQRSKTQMLWRKHGSPRVVLTPLTPADPQAYMASQTGALIHFLLSEDGGPPVQSKSRSWFRRGLLSLASRLQGEAARPQIADMAAMLQVLLWGPRLPLLDHSRPAAAVHHWLTVKRALLVMKLAERGLIQDQSPLDWEDCMCLQYLAFTDPSAVVSVSSQLWLNVNMVDAS